MDHRPGARGPFARLILGTAWLWLPISVFSGVATGIDQGARALIHDASAVACPADPSRISTLAQVTHCL